MFKTLKEIAQAGFSRGQHIASWVDVPGIGDMPTRDEACSTSFGFSPVSNLSEAKELFMQRCYEAEQAGRDFSPFEFTAHALNEYKDSERAWEVYESEMARAWSAACRKRVTRSFVGKDL